MRAARVIVGVILTLLAATTVVELGRMGIGLGLSTTTRPPHDAGARG